MTSFHPQKEHALSWKVNTEILMGFKGIIGFICNVRVVVCREVFAGDDAQLSGIPMQNDQSHIKSEICNVWGHTTRHMLFQETYSNHQ